MHIVDGCQQWRALSTWDDDYLSKQFGNFGIKPMKIASTKQDKSEQRFDKFIFHEEDSKQMSETMTMQSFTDKRNYLQDFTHKGSIEDDTDSYLGS